MIRTGVFGLLEIALAACLSWALHTYVPSLTCLMMLFVVAVIYPLARSMVRTKDRLVMQVSVLKKIKDQAFSDWLWGHVLIFGISGLAIYAFAPEGLALFLSIAAGLLIVSGVGARLFLNHFVSGQ